MLKVFCAGSLVLSVLMLMGLLQQRNSNFEGVVCAQEICCSRVWIPLSPVSRQLNKQMEKQLLLEGLRTCKPPAEFQDVCLNFFCAVRATLQLEDFNVAGLTRRQFAVFIIRAGFRFPLLRSYTML